MWAPNMAMWGAYLQIGRLVPGAAGGHAEPLLNVLDAVEDLIELQRHLPILLSRGQVEIANLAAGASRDDHLQLARLPAILGEAPH